MKNYYQSLINMNIYKITIEKSKLYNNLDLEYFDFVKIFVTKLRNKYPGKKARDYLKITLIIYNAVKQNMGVEINIDDYSFNYINMESNMNDTSAIILR